MSWNETEPDVPPEWRFRMILQGLDAMHAWRGWKWRHPSDPFEVVVGSILVQHTAWANVERSLDNLREAGLLEPEAMARADDDLLATITRPSGPTTRKVQTLKAVLALAPCRASLDRLLARPHEDLRETLLSIHGIGEETADTIILYAAHQPEFIIDAYTRRIFSRLGMGPGESAPNPEWKAFFDEYLEPDADLFGHIHALIVEHAKNLCRKQAPRCNRCVLQHRCLEAPPHLERIYERAASR